MDIDVMDAEPETIGEMLWSATWFGDDMVVHPFGDEKSHLMTSEACACGPAIEHVRGKRMITHNAFDGRE